MVILTEHPRRLPQQSSRSDREVGHRREEPRNNTMGGEPVLRRRPVGAEGRRAAPPRENVTGERRGDVQEVFSSVLSEFSSRAESFVKGLG